MRRCYKCVRTGARQSGGGAGLVDYEGECKKEVEGITGLKLIAGHSFARPPGSTHSKERRRADLYGMRGGTGFIIEVDQFAHSAREYTPEDELDKCQHQSAALRHEHPHVTRVRLWEPSQHPLLWALGASQTAGVLSPQQCLIRAAAPPIILPLSCIVTCTLTISRLFVSQNPRYTCSASPLVLAPPRTRSAVTGLVNI